MFFFSGDGKKKHGQKPPIGIFRAKCKKTQSFPGKKKHQTFALISKIMSPPLEYILSNWSLFVTYHGLFRLFTPSKRYFFAKQSLKVCNKHIHILSQLYTFGNMEVSSKFRKYAELNFEQFLASSKMKCFNWIRARQKWVCTLLLIIWMDVRASTISSPCPRSASGALRYPYGCFSGT